MKEYEKIVFLDIDGVLQGYSRQKRFDHIHTIPLLQEELTEKYQVDYTKYDKYDVGAVYYDWDPHALSLLKKILEETGAMIVISSDWRRLGLQQMIDFFRLYGLNEYIVDVTEDLTRDELDSFKHKYNGNIYEERTFEILKYLEKNPHIQNYVAIDDLNLSRGPEGHFVQTAYLIEDDDCEKAIAILNNSGVF